MTAMFVDAASNFHPFECNGTGSCVHCDRETTDNHHPDVCALCDPDYDLQRNSAWDERVANDARRDARKAQAE